MAVQQDLRADRAHVAQCPGRVVLQSLGERHVVPALQVRPAARIAGEVPGRTDVGQGVAERLPVVEPLRQLDGPLGPAHRRLQPVVEHVELGLIAVRHGELPTRFDGLQHGDRAGAGRFRLRAVAVPPVQPREPAQRLPDLFPVAGGLPQRHGGLSGRDRLDGQTRQVALHRVLLEQLGADRLRQSRRLRHGGPVVFDGLPVGPDRGRPPGRVRRIPQYGVHVAGLAGVMHQSGDIHVPLGIGRQHVEDPPVQLPAGQYGQGALDRPSEQFVPEPDRVPAHDEEPGRDTGLDRLSREPTRLFEQPQLGAGRDDRDQPRDLLRVRRQGAVAGQDQVAHGQRHAGVVRRQHFGDEQRVAAGQRVQSAGLTAGPPRPVRPRPPASAARVAVAAPPPGAAGRPPSATDGRSTARHRGR